EEEEEEEIEKGERVLLEDELFSTVEAVHICILRGLKMIERKFTEDESYAEQTVQRSEAIGRFIMDKEEFEQKEALEGFGEEAKAVLNQLAETLEAKTCTLRSKAYRRVSSIYYCLDVQRRRSDNRFSFGLRKASFGMQSTRKQKTWRKLGRYWRSNRRKMRNWRRNETS
ncbi:hypothetical protein PENTCL1PPCAC_19236, partial [Pristionchus entomophagus]